VTHTGVGSKGQSFSRLHLQSPICMLQQIAALAVWQPRLASSQTATLGMCTYIRATRPHMGAWGQRCINQECLDSSLPRPVAHLALRRLHHCSAVCGWGTE
jgi:hypothetical protein